METTESLAPDKSNITNDSIVPVESEESPVIQDMSSPVQSSGTTDNVCIESITPDRIPQSSDETSLSIQTFDSSNINTQTTANDSVEPMTVADECSQTYPELNNSKDLSPQDTEITEKSVSYVPGNHTDLHRSEILDITSEDMIMLESPKFFSEDLHSSDMTEMETKTEHLDLVDSRYVTDFMATPLQLAECRTDFTHTPDNFLKGCKWAPDGTCLLVNSNDNILRLYNLPPELYGDVNHVSSWQIPEMSSVLQIAESELIYDYAWYPLMSSERPETCCLASTGRDNPVHLWDAFTGELRGSYRAFDHVDELTAAYSVAFSPDGQRLYCGFNKAIRVFNVHRPGRECKTRATYAKKGQAGIISCIAFNPTSPKLYGAGSYSRSVGLYSEPEGSLLCLFQGQQGGVTHIVFSNDGNCILTGGRKDPEILCWDLRNPGQILYTMMRDVATNQRIYFEMDDSGHVISGNHNGEIRVWDTKLPPVPQENGDPILEPLTSFQAHPDCVNGVSLHPSLPVMATASGQRHYSCVLNDSDDSSCEEESIENSLKLWWMNNTHCHSTSADDTHM